MLKTRVITALVLVVALAAVLFLLPRPAADACFAAIAALAGWEWAGLMKLGRRGRVVYGAVIALSCLAAYFLGPLPWLWLAAVVFWLLLAPLCLARHWPLVNHRLGGLALGWLLLLSTWLAMVALHGRSPWMLLAAMALVWAADTAAYFAGRAFGRHKLAPAISPGKTWEGVLGAIVGVLIYGFALPAGAGPWQEVGAPAMALILVLLTGVSIEGDLLESLVKRQADVKDSSALLPGHGGILDRIDSLLSALPLAALILYWRTA